MKIFGNKITFSSLSNNGKGRNHKFTGQELVLIEKFTILLLEKFKSKVKIQNIDFIDFDRRYEGFYDSFLGVTEIIEKTYTIKKRPFKFTFRKIFSKDKKDFSSLNGYLKNSYQDNNINYVSGIYLKEEDIETFLIPITYNEHWIKDNHLDIQDVFSEDEGERILNEFEDYINIIKTKFDTNDFDE